MTAKDIVKRHSKSCKDARILAQRIYDDLKQLNYKDANLIDVYHEMYRLGLSTYELECLTHKRLRSSVSGWKLEDVNPMNGDSKSIFAVLDNAITNMKSCNHNDDVESHT